MTEAHRAAFEILRGDLFDRLGAEALITGVANMSEAQTLALTDAALALMSQHQLAESSFRFLERTFRQPEQIVPADPAVSCKGTGAMRAEGEPAPSPEQKGSEQ